RDSHQQDAAQIHQNKGPTAVLAGDIGELPDIAKTHGRARGRQNKRPATGPGPMDSPPCSAAHICHTYSHQQLRPVPGPSGRRCTTADCTPPPVAAKPRGAAISSPATARV